MQADTLFLVRYLVAYNFSVYIFNHYLLTSEISWRKTVALALKSFTCVPRSSYLRSFVSLQLCTASFACMLKKRGARALPCGKCLCRYFEFRRWNVSLPCIVSPGVWEVVSVHRSAFQKSEKAPVVSSLFFMAYILFLKQQHSRVRGFFICGTQTDHIVTLYV